MITLYKMFNIFNTKSKKISNTPPTSNHSTKSQGTQYENIERKNTEDFTTKPDETSLYMVEMNSHPTFYTNTHEEAVNEIYRILNLILFNNKLDDITIEEDDLLDEYTVYKKLDFILFNMNCKILYFKIHEIVKLSNYYRPNINQIPENPPENSPENSPENLSENLDEISSNQLSD
jgi:hypothetical protein